MPAPMSMDLRLRIVGAVESGSSIRGAAARFAVSPSAAIKLMQRVRATGSAAPARYGGHRRPKLEPHEGELRELVAARPDLTLAELQTALQQHCGVRAGLSTIHTMLHRIGLRLKKTLKAAEQDRPDGAGERRRWRRWQPFMEPARFVFLDETATVTNMTRRYGRSPSDQRLVAAVPHGHWRTTTFVAGLRQTGIVAPLVRDGRMTGAAFRAYVEQSLAPALPPGDVVVLDNLATHKVDGVRQAIAAAGASILDLPAYSPDFAPGSQHRPPRSVRSGAPIEQLFAKLKALRRKAAARTKDELWPIIGRLLDRWSANECSDYLHHCGYGSPLTGR
jgi:transposase